MAWTHKINRFAMAHAIGAYVRMNGGKLTDANCIENLGASARTITKLRTAYNKELPLTKEQDVSLDTACKVKDNLAKFGIFIMPEELTIAGKALGDEHIITLMGRSLLRGTPIGSQSCRLRNNDELSSCKH